MATYQIVCTTKEPHRAAIAHHHIVAVGTLLSAGGHRAWTVAQVYAAIDAGDTFRTLSPSLHIWSEVQKFPCAFCKQDTLRAQPDAARDNNLGSLPGC